jgi:hypothetical protein
MSSAPDAHNATHAERSLQWLLLAVACVAVAMYLPTLRNQYVYDDLEIVVRNPLMRSFATFPKLLTSPYWYSTGNLYRPVTSLTLGLDYVLGGGSAVVSHVVNILLHAGVTVMVGLLASRWLPRYAAVVAALVFAIHPVHVEAVSTAVGRAELLCAATMLALTLLVTRQAPITLKARAATAMLAALSLGSKEIGVVAPAVAFLAASAIPAQRRAAWQWSLAALAGAVPMLVMRLIVLGTLGGDPTHPAFKVGSLVAVKGLALGMSLRAFSAVMLPTAAPIDAAPPLQQAIAPSVAQALLGAAIVLAIGVVVLRHFRRPTLVTLSVAIAAAAWAPTSNLLFSSGVVLAGRTLYSPSIGVALLAGVLAAVAMQCRSLPLRAVIGGAGAAWIVVAVIVTSRDMAIWRESDRIAATIIARQPENFRGHVYSAELARDRKDMPGAVRHYRDAIALFPKERYLLYSAGIAALEIADTSAATRWLGDAVDVAPNHWQARTRLVKVLAARGDTAQARGLLDDGLVRIPTQQTWRSMRAQLSH